MMSCGASHYYMECSHNPTFIVGTQALCKTKMYRKIVIEFVESRKNSCMIYSFFNIVTSFCRDERVKVKQTQCEDPSHSHRSSPGRIESQYYVFTSLQDCQDVSDNQNRMIRTNQSYFQSFFMVFIKTRTRQIFFIHFRICSRNKM